MNNALSVLWAALKYHGSKKVNREQLEDGKSYPVKIKIVGTIGEKDIKEVVCGLLTVDHSAEKAPSVTPYKAMLGMVLDKLNPRTKAKVLQDIATAWQQNALNVDDTTLEQVDAISRSVRQSMAKVEVRGAVKFKEKEGVL